MEHMCTNWGGEEAEGETDSLQIREPYAGLDPTAMGWLPNPKAVA